MQTSLDAHRKWGGKFEIVSRAPVTNKEELSIAYTPGVAEPCKEIAKNEALAYEYTRKGNLVAVITDGTAVLGLGDIGPSAAMPVMEGKCVLFKEFAGIDAIPICIDSKDSEELIRTIHLISKSFGGINLEDISAPRCFEIEARLKELCDIPVFHDDQHGTAIVASAALLNAVKVAGKGMGKLKIVINGAGAAGLSIARLMGKIGFGEILLCDISGIICEGDSDLSAAHAEAATWTNKKHQRGKLAEALAGADVFIGVSKGKLLNVEMIRTMAENAIVFAMANPVPEITPEQAKEGGALIIGTGRSDYPNQINNVLAFPGIFKGVLSARVQDITEEMKIAAAYAIAEVLRETELTPEYIIPDPFDRRVAEAVANAVIETAKRAYK